MQKADLHVVLVHVIRKRTYKHLTALLISEVILQVRTTLYYGFTERVKYGDARRDKGNERVRIRMACFSHLTENRI
jgi:ribulose bisphosphate carboxylase small subunit